MVWLNLLTGEARAARCGRNGCSVCIVANARRRALALALAKPQREIRVSLVADAQDPDPWVTARRRMNRIREYMARWETPIGEWAYFVEKNPAETGFHAHVMQRGQAKVDKDLLEEASQQAGAGLTRIRKVKSAGDLAAYGLKGIALAAYGLKGTDDNDGGTEFLRLNGGRLGHFSRNYFVSAAGGTLGVRQAERAALEAVYGHREGAGAWTLVSERAATSYRSVVPGSSTAAIRARATRAGGSKTAGSTAAEKAQSAS